MKKTQKIIDILAFIQSKDLTCDEAKQLLVEIEDIEFREEETGEWEENPYNQIERENCENLDR
jgi:hypothetical protein